MGALQFIALIVQAVIFHRTLEENRRLIEASSISANAAKQSADTATLALHLTERADVAIGSVQGSTGPVFTHETITNVIMKNCGRTRANGVTIVAWFGSPDARPSDAIGLDCVPMVLVPQATAHVPIGPWGLAAENLSAVNGGGMALTVEIEYRDVFNNTHRTKESGVFRRDQKGGFSPTRVESD